MKDVLKYTVITIAAILTMIVFYAFILIVSLVEVAV